MNDRSFPLDKRQVRRAFARAARSYDAAAVLQRTIGERLIQRLEIVKLQPQRILDAGAGTGYCTRLLTRRYRRAEVIAVDIAQPLLSTARQQRGWFSRSRYVGGDIERLPFADDGFDLVISNLSLQWCDPARAFGELLRVLRPGGLLMFTSFGPDTLIELRRAWAAVDRAAHVHGFIDMHDLGDALVHAGFAEPVMDVEHYTLTYAEVADVMRDLKAIGAHNADRERARGLTGKRRFERFIAAYETARRDGRIPATYEAVYGHAWAPAIKPTMQRRADGSIGIPLRAIRRS